MENNLLAHRFGFGKNPDTRTERFFAKEKVNEKITSTHTQNIAMFLTLLPQNKKMLDDAELTPKI